MSRTSLASWYRRILLFLLCGKLVWQRTSAACMFSVCTDGPGFYCYIASLPIACDPIQARLSAPGCRKPGMELRRVLYRKSLC
ncbi:hypothetical protein BKA83DRAFT_4279959 [Pisolithus microcarpus]|nr:hypothetical protein BKA83DRAFT_4279959 [Pisolithus microcarpus]